MSGIDVLVRPETKIPVQPFDGQRIPFADGAFDAVSFVDVLHHTDDPIVLLREAVRVAKTAVVIKDHLADGVLARPTLRFMDWVGNAGHGVVLPYNYWTQPQWSRAFARARACASTRRSRASGSIRRRPPGCSTASCTPSGGSCRGRAMSAAELELTILMPCLNEAETVADLRAARRAGFLERARRRAARS